MPHNNQDDMQRLENPKTPIETVEERRKKRNPKSYTGKAKEEYKKYDDMDKRSLAMMDGVEEYGQVRQGQSEKPADNC